MKYTPYPISDRIAKLKESYLKTTVAKETDSYSEKVFKCFGSGDRFITLEFLEGWLKHQKAPSTFRRRALAEAEELYGAEPTIMDGELITGQPYLPEYTPEKMERYLKLFEMFKMSSIHAVFPLRADHIGLDFDKLLKLGVNGLIKEIKDKQAALDINDRGLYPNLDAIEANDYYESCLVELEAVLDLQKRYAKAARELSDRAAGERKHELIRMADALDRVPAEPARNFVEAVQSVNFFIGTVQGLYPLNRPDRYLYPFYEKDIADGILTPEEAQEIIDNFCLLVSTRVFSRAACGFIVGGRDADGNVVENDLTYMFLTALDHIRMPDPNGALAVCDDTSDDIIRYATEILSRGVTHPAFYNDDAIVSSLERIGVLHEDAVNYIHTTCAEISVVGKSRAYTTPVIIDVPAIVTDVAENASDNITFEEIKKGVAHGIYEQLRVQTPNYLLKILEGRKNSRDPIRMSCLIDDCIARGKNYQNGGERYTFLQPIMVGIGSAVDSLVAIKHIVYDEKRLTLSEFAKIVSEDFAGNEPLRQYIINKLPHYGNCNEESDSLAAWLYGEISDMTKNSPIAAGHIIVPGTFSYIFHETLGRKDGASFDGRHAGVAYSDGCCPVQGMDTNGPTSTILSLTSFDQSDFLAGMVVNLKFSPEHITGKHADNFVTLLRTFVKRGGIEMQVNVVDRATLIDAQEHPEKHGDLIVRIGGYSDYFVRLTKGMQNEVIARSEH